MKILETNYFLDAKSLAYQLVIDFKIKNGLRFKQLIKYHQS